MARLVGEVLRYLPARGFGFIAAGEEAVFFHISQCENRDLILRPGDVVSFVTGISSKTGRNEAQDIKIVAKVPRTIDAGTFEAPTTAGSKGGAA